MGAGNCGFPGSEAVCVSLAAILAPNILISLWPWTTRGVEDYRCLSNQGLPVCNFTGCANCALKATAIDG